MRRRLVNVILILLAFVIQTSLFPLVPYLVVSPNLLLIVIFSIAFVYGEIDGVVFGVLAGLLMDMFYSGPFGYFTIIYGWIGFINGFFSSYYYDDYIFLPMIMCTVNEVIYNMLLFIMRYIQRGKTDFFYYLRTLILPELILTVLFALLLYRGIIALNRKLKKLDDTKKVNQLVQ